MRAHSRVLSVYKLKIAELIVKLVLAHVAIRIAGHVATMTIAVTRIDFIARRRCKGTVLPGRHALDHVPDNLWRDRMSERGNCQAQRKASFQPIPYMQSRSPCCPDNRHCQWMHVLRKPADTRIEPDFPIFLGKGLPFRGVDAVPKSTARH